MRFVLVVIGGCYTKRGELIDIKLRSVAQ